MTFRAVETLQRCDLILCEDTRHSAVLMKHYEITTPLRSYHKFSEAKEEEQVLALLHSGKEVALISDAGTPAVADPGERLVKRCVEEGLAITAIPGACAAITALTLSGFPTDTFQFVGFLSKKESALGLALTNITLYPGTTVCYEAPHRIAKLLEKIAQVMPDRRLCLARELTKKFEERRYGTAGELLEGIKNTPPKGEIVLLIEGCKDNGNPWPELSAPDLVSLLEKEFLIKKSDAIKVAADLRGVAKRDVYKEIIL